MIVKQRNRKRSIISHTFQCLRLIIILATTILAQSPDRIWHPSSSGNVKYSNDCKFDGGVYNQIDIYPSNNCDKLCEADERCTHFTYSYSKRQCLLRKFDKYVYPIEENSKPSDGTLCAYVIKRV